MNIAKLNDAKGFDIAKLNESSGFDTSLSIRIVIAFTIFFMSYEIAKLYRDYLLRKWIVSGNLKTANLLYYYVSTLIYYGIIASGLSISLYILQLMPALNITIIGVLGAVLWAIGNNMMSLYSPGIYIIANGSFTIGQRLTIRKDMNTVIAKGVVTDFDLTNTTLKVENSFLVVPNSMIKSNIITVE
jgi:hypothetical protein